MFIDPNGDFAISLASLFTGMVIGALVGAGLSMMSTLHQD